MATVTGSPFPVEVLGSQLDVQLQFVQLQQQTYGGCVH